MTKLIDFLEQLGSDAKLRHDGGEGFGRAIEMAGIDASVRHAILTADQDSLEALAGASANVFCGLHAPDDAPDEGETPPSPAEPEEARRTVTRGKRAGKKKASKKKKSSPKKKAPARKKKVSKKKSGKKKKSSKKTSRRKK